MKLRLSYKILLPVIGFTFIFNLIVVVYIYYSETKIINQLMSNSEQNIKKELDNRKTAEIKAEDSYLSILLKMSAGVASAQLYNFNVDALKLTVAEVLPVESIRGVYVWDKAGKNYFYGIEKSKSKLVEHKNPTKEMDSFKKIEQPMINSGEQVGTLIVFQDPTVIENKVAIVQRKSLKALEQFNKDMNSEVSSAFVSQFLMMLLGIGVIAIITFILLNKIVKEPMTTLSNGLNEFFKFLQKETESAVPININTKDEMEDMTLMINDSIIKIEQSIKEDKEIVELITNVARDVRSGSLVRRIDAQTKNFTLNELIRVLNEMLDNLEKIVGKDVNVITDLLEVYSKYDFTKTIDNPKGKIEDATINLQFMIVSMLEQNNELGNTLKQVSNTLKGSTDNLSSSMVAQAASVEETSAALEEINSNLKDTTNRAMQMSQLSNTTKKNAQSGMELSGESAKSMNEINEATIEIETAIEAINQIAFQINILSLNAAVEAATAGEAGRGFAVVAQEVRNLATKSKETSDHIAEIVEKAKVKVEDGLRITESMQNEYSTLAKNIEKTSLLVDEVSGSAQKQMSGLQQINDSLVLIDGKTQENANVSQDINSIAQQADGIAKQILEEVNSKKF